MYVYIYIYREREIYAMRPAGRRGGGLLRFRSSPLAASRVVQYRELVCITIYCII